MMHSINQDLASTKQRLNEKQTESCPVEQNISNLPCNNLSPLEQLPNELLRKIILFTSTTQKSDSSMYSLVKKKIHDFQAMGGINRRFYYLINDDYTQKAFFRSLKEKIRSIDADFFSKVLSLDIDITELVNTLFKEADVVFQEGNKPFCLSDKYEVVILKKKSRITSSVNFFISLNLESITIFTPLRLIEIHLSSHKKKENVGIDMLAIAEGLINRLGATFMSAMNFDPCRTYYKISAPNLSGVVRRVTPRDFVRIKSIEKNAEESQTVIVPEIGYSLYRIRNTSYKVA